MTAPQTKGAAGGYAMVAIAAASWGMWPLLLKRAESFGGLDPSFESFVVMVAITVSSAPLLLRDRSPERATGKQWVGIAWLGIGDALNVVLFFRAYQATSVAIAVITHYLTPIFVAVAAPLLLRERARGRTYAAAAVGFAGLVVMLRPWAANREATDAVGAAMGAGSAVFYASNVIVNKRLSRSFSGAELMFFHGLVAVPLLALFVPSGAWSHLDARAMAWLIGGSLGPGALSGLLFTWGLRRIPASHASTLTLLEPLVAVAVASIALGQHVQPSTLVGGAIILLSTIAVIVK